MVIASRNVAKLVRVTGRSARIIPYTDQKTAAVAIVTKVVADISFVDDVFQARTTCGISAIVERKAAVYPSA